MNAPLFIHPERALAQQLGLPLEKIREMRASGFVRGTDWQREANEIRYSEAGLAKLTAALGTAASPVAPELETSRAALCLTLMTRVDQLAEIPQKNSAPNAPAAAQPGAERELVVWRTFVPNRRIVLARDGAVTVRVRVRDNRKLMPGMKMRCVHVEHDLWALNQRLPRNKGRW